MLKGKILYAIDIYSVIKTQNIKIIVKIAENKKKSTEFVEIRYILQVCSRHLTL